MAGGGMTYPFTTGTGTVHTPRVWAGSIYYVTKTGPNMLSTVSKDYEDDVADGVMFDIRATWTGVTVRGDLQVELAAGTHDVDVYFRRGTSVGHETSDEGWVLVGGITGAVSAGGGALTSIRLDRAGLYLGTLEVGALYVDTHGTGLRISPGMTVGDTAESYSLTQLAVGRAMDADFGGLGPAAIFRGAFQTQSCSSVPR
jgi:hypothetical protein